MDSIKYVIINKSDVTSEMYDNSLISLKPIYFQETNVDIDILSSALKSVDGTKELIKFKGSPSCFDGMTILTQSEVDALLLTDEWNIGSPYNEDGSLKW
tara:strand:- start:8848 stop:9144 length:297 start_codon:yes stop_codon:yes gene_type:complete